MDPRDPSRPSWGGSYPRCLWEGGLRSVCVWGEESYLRPRALCQEGAFIPPTLCFAGLPQAVDLVLDHPDHVGV